MSEKWTEVRKAIKEFIEKQKMFIENEPDFSGHPLNTIAPEKNEGNKKINKEVQNKSEAKSKLRNHIKNLPVVKKPYVSEENKTNKSKI